MKKIFYTSLLVTGLWFLFSFIAPIVASGQDDGWKVWVKVSPCSGRFDWISVAKNNPTGGLNYFYLANQIFPGAGCTLQGCTFATATAVATSLRTSSEFSKYCCRDYSVWKHSQTGQMTVVVGKFGTAGLGWQIVKGDLCCEEAEALSGIVGACSGSNQQVNTQCWPGSYAAINPQTGKTECYCNPGLVWNSTKTACITPDVRNVDCSGYPGSYAVWSDQNKRYECWCPEGKTWNSTRTACVDVVSQVSCWPGSYAAVNPQTGKTECYCNPGLVWNSTKTACVQPSPNPNDIGITEIVVTQQNVTISVWDHGCEDGDIINLLINGQVYLSNHILTNAKKNFNVTLNTGNNYLEIVAVDSGTDCPPNSDKTKTRNSAAIHITNAVQGGDQSWELTMGASTRANFVVRP